MGRDVVAYKQNGWDNYQCKYYADRLSVADAVLEVAKLIYYSYIGEYELPDAYKFVSPKGAGVQLLKLLNDKTGSTWRKEIYARWEKICKNGITAKKEIVLDLSLKDYIEKKVDFSIFDEIPPIKLIELHSNTPYHAIRFGIYHKKRPTPPKAPMEINWKEEQGYIAALLKAFSQNKNSKLEIDNLTEHPSFAYEMSSARNNFFRLKLWISFHKTGCRRRAF